MTADDIPEMFRIRAPALLPSQAPISCLLFRPLLSPQMRQREAERLESGSGVYFFKAVDDGNGMISCLRARNVPKQTEAPPSGAPPPPANCPIGAAAWQQCFMQLTKAKDSSFDNVQHICTLRDHGWEPKTNTPVDVDLLATDPAHQGRGAARCLLEKLGKIADEAGLQTFLVSTDSARPVYKKASFAPVQALELDLGRIGEAGGGRERFTVSLPQSDMIQNKN